MAVDTAAAVKAALSKQGSPYVWGAEGPSTFDCSGLMVWAYQKAGVKLPRTSQEQAKYGTAVPYSKMQPGDLITSNWGSGPSSHVAMYLGGGKIIHAPRPGTKVVVRAIDADYRSHINAIRRVPGATSSGVTPALDIPGPGDLLGLFGDTFGGGAIGEGLAGAAKAGSAALSSIGKSMQSVGAVAEFLLKLALPSTWVRIACGLLGSVILFLGVAFLVREATGGPA